MVVAPADWRSRDGEGAAEQRHALEPHGHAAAALDDAEALAPGGALSRGGGRARRTFDARDDARDVDRDRDRDRDRGRLPPWQQLRPELGRQRFWAESPHDEPGRRDELLAPAAQRGCGDDGALMVAFENAAGGEALELWIAPAERWVGGEGGALRGGDRAVLVGAVEAGAAHWMCSHAGHAFFWARAADAP